MKGVGGTQRTALQRQQEVLRSAVYIAGQLDAMIDALVETLENRVLKPPRRLSGERPLVQASCNRRDDLGDGQIGHEHIIPAFYDLVEFVASWFGQIELQQGAGIAVEGAGEPRAVGGPSLGEPCGRAPPRDDLCGPGRQ
jgi:hypothetical protein